MLAWSIIIPGPIIKLIPKVLDWECRHGLSLFLGLLLTANSKSTWVGMLAWSINIPGPIINS